MAPDLEPLAEALQIGFDAQNLADQAAQARHIFEALRAFDHAEVTDIWAQSPTDTGIGLAVTNRLNKAAGFHIISLEG